MRNTYKNPNGQDASNYIEDILNNPFDQIPAGHYLITRPIKQSINKRIDATNVVLYTIKDHSVLILEQQKIDISNLKIDTSLVLNGNPDNTLIRLNYNKINLQFSIINNVTLTGSIFSKRSNGRNHELMEFGHTGLLSDAITETEDKYKDPSNGMGEFHWNTFNLYLEYLHTGIHLPLDSREGKGVPNSRNNINIIGIRCKKLADINGGQSNINYRYNNSHTLLENQKDFDLLAVRGDYTTIKTSLADASNYKREKTKNGIPVFSHRYKATIYGEKCRSLDWKYDWGEFNEIEPLIK